MAGVGALQNIDSGCGDTGKLVYDAAALSDPEIDYSDYDTDKDGVVDFFMVVFAGCGGNGASQLGPAGCDYPGAPYDNVWPHSSSLMNGFTDPVTGLPGYTTDDQLENLEGQPLWYTDTSYTDTTTTPRSDAPSRSSSASVPTTSTRRPPSTSRRSSPTSTATPSACRTSTPPAAAPPTGPGP